MASYDPEQNNDNISLPGEWSGWDVTELIGSGAFGTVYIAEKDGEECAIKIIRIPSDDSERAALIIESKNEQTAQLYLKDLVENYNTEIRSMYSLQDNPHIVQIEDHLIKELKPFGYCIYIRMELLTPIREFYAGRALTEEEAVKVGLDICDALIACDERRIIHRDIKPDNIFVSPDGDFKLGDFGTARQLDLTFGTYSAKGTFSFMAPEVYHSERYNKQVDIYSLGIVLYRFMNRNRDPFLDPGERLIYYQDREEALRRRMDGEPLPSPADASEKFSSVILRACAYDAKMRYPDALSMREDLLKVLDPSAEIEVFNPDSMPAQEDSASSVEYEGLYSDKSESVDNDGRRNRHSFVSVMITVLILCLAAAGGLYTYRIVFSPDKDGVITVSSEDTVIGKYNEEEGQIKGRRTGTETDPDMKEAVYAADGIATELADYALKDKEAFSSYFLNADETIIDQYYMDFNQFNDYPNRCLTPVAKTDNVYLINLIGYMDGEADQDSTLEWSRGWNLYMSKENGKWKINMDEAEISQINEYIRENTFPAGYAKALADENCHNRIMIEHFNYLHICDSSVYSGMCTMEVRFLWQEENGDLLITVLFANGTKDEYIFQDLYVQLNDREIGTILSGFLPDDISVEAGKNRICTYRFDADNVLTGTQDWSDVTPVIKVQRSGEE